MNQALLSLNGGFTENHAIGSKKKAYTGGLTPPPLSFKLMVYRVFIPNAAPPPLCTGKKRKISNPLDKFGN